MPTMIAGKGKGALMAPPLVDPEPGPAMDYWPGWGVSEVLRGKMG